MNEREQRQMASRLCEQFEQFEFDTALEIVQWRPHDAQDLLDLRAEMDRRQEERRRNRKRLQRALIEEFG